MLPFKKVVFPVDYSEACEAIAPAVRDTVEKFGASLTLVHAYGAEALAETNLRLADPALFQEIHTIQENKLREWAAKYFEGIKFEPIVKLGEASAAIHDVLKANGADLVMMPTHGHGAFRRMLVGSVAAKILHDFDGAIWTASRESVERGPGAGYRSILCAVDLGEEMEGVLRAGAAIAKRYDAELNVVHSIETPPLTTEFDFTPYRNDMFQSAHATIAAMLEKLGIKCSHTVVDGPPAAAVGQEAVARGVDLVVTGRGRIHGTMGRLWSNMYAIVREAHCPVLSV